MCRVLAVSESGYYKFEKNLGKPDKDALLSAEIKKILDESVFNDNYGVPRMKIALFNKGISVGTRKLTRLMRELGLIHEHKRRPTPFKKVLTDISQIQCFDGKLYISPSLDCFDGSILSLLMRDNMKKELSIDTAIVAVQRYPQLRGAIYHSDRGSQYTSEEFKKTLATLGMTQSLSGVDCCYDNARMESFFATLKKELLYRIPTYRMTKEEVKTIIFRYVFTYYNTVRIHTSNPDGLPPISYRMTWQQEEKEELVA